MAAETTIRDSLNSQNPNRICPALAGWFGEAMSALIAGLAATEAGVVPAGNILATLANQPDAMLQVNATAAGVVGIKKLLIGPITGAGAIVPKTGECVWNGGLLVAFPAADAVTAVSFTYSVAGTATTGCSLLRRNLGESDAPA
jgi:hypothetical protein